MKNEMLSIEKMLEIETWIDNVQSSILHDFIENENLLQKLNLKLEYVDQKDFPANTEAELRPCEDKNYYGLIRLNNNYVNTRFAYMHEIIHYLMDVGFGNYVTKVFSRRTKGNTIDNHEQEINYATAATILRYSQMKDIILKYDRSKPKMDELAMVNDICKEYGQEQTTVIRRVQEVRKLMKKRMTSY